MLRRALLVAVFALSVCSLPGQVFCDPPSDGNVAGLALTGEPRIGEQLTFTVTGTAGEVASILFATSEGRLPLFDWGTLLIDPATLIGDITFTIGSGSTGNQQRTVLPTAIPGARAICQALILNGSQVRITNTCRLFILGNTGRRADLLTLDAYPAQTRAAAITFTGRTAIPGSTVLVDGGLRQVQTTATGRDFSISVPLIQNRNSSLFFHEITTANFRYPAVTAELLHDAEPPRLFADFPAAGTKLTSSHAVLAGRVSDRLSGFMGMTVEALVQNQTYPGIVEPGIGTNGTYEIRGIPLPPPPSQLDLTIRATDPLGNRTDIPFRLEREALTGLRMQATDGDAQTGVAFQLLPEPFVVRILDPQGNPFEGKLVTYEVTRSDGELFDNANPGSSRGTRRLQLETDSNGYARTWLRLGADAGCGNNRVEVRSRDISEYVAFCASATAGAPRQLAVSRGNEQTGQIYTELAQPLRAWVSDGCNGVAGVPVLFEVQDGNGLLLTDAGTPVSALTVRTDRAGYAAARYIAGGATGAQFVHAQVGTPFTSNELTFFANILGPSSNRPSTLTGLIIDNSQRPLGGTTLVLHLPNGDFTTTSDQDGCFVFDPIDQEGPAHLEVDGSTVTTVGGQPLSGYRFPGLEYELLINRGQDIRMARPIQLPELIPGNDRAYDPMNGNTLTVPEVEGLVMHVAPNSMFINGSPAPAGTVLSLNHVHVDEIPDAHERRAALPFAWTLLPHGATFDPPIRIEYPNMSGLAPGSIAYFLSFDHDTAKFEIVASSHVTEDGSKIITDPNDGLRKAGWGCNCPPYAVTTDCNYCTTTCLVPGVIQGRSPSVTPSTAMLGESVVFSAGALTDTGAVAVRKCKGQPRRRINIPPQPVITTWRVTTPSGQVLPPDGPGFGSRTPPILLSECGVYRCQFDAIANHAPNCPPATARIGPVSMAATKLTQ